MICYVVLPHPNRASLLLKHSTAGWALPYIDVDSTTLIAYQTEQVRDLLRNKLGCDAVVLQKLVSLREYHCLEMDLLQQMQVNPLVYQWHNLDRLPNTEYDSTETRTMVINWLKQGQDSEFEATLTAWQRSGWFRQAEAWIYEQLDFLDWQATGPVLQIKGSQRNSCLLYLRTNQGDLFFKAGSPILPVESQITAELAQMFPGEIPEFVAVDHERNWMLMRDFGRNHVGTADERYLPLAAKRMAEIQVETSSDLEQWATLGCELWDVQWITEQLAQAPAMLMNFDQGKNYIDPELIKRLASRVPKIHKLVTDLFNFPLPLTLVHAEFHSAHVLVNETGFMFHDWDGCVVTHPYFSLHSLLFANNNEELSPVICDAFIEPFLQFGNEQRQQQLIEISGKLFWLFVYLNMRRLVLPMAADDHRRKGFLTHMAEHLERGLSLIADD